MATPGDELHDIADPGPLLPAIEVPLWFWITAATLAVAALTLLVLFLRRHRGTAPPPEVPHYREAREALNHLRESLPGRSLVEVATEASLIMRHYLAATLQEPALYETHEEFLLRDDALDRLPAGARGHLAPLLGRLAAAKYSPGTPDHPGAASLLDSCLEVLQGVESTHYRPVA